MHVSPNSNNSVRSNDLGHCPTIMKFLMVTACLWLALAGCSPNSETQPAGIAVVEIRVGDSMKSVLAHLKTWEAQETHFCRYSVFVPEDLDDGRSYEEHLKEYRAKNPYSDLPAFVLPNDLVVDFHSQGEVLTSLSQEIVGDSKLDSKTIHGFTGLRYDGDWKLVRDDWDEGEVQ